MLNGITTTKNRITVYQVLKGRCNVFVVQNKKACILVDTSVSKYWNELADALDNFVHQGCIFTGLVITHSHFDHVINAHLAKQKYKMKLYIREEESEFLCKGYSSDIRGTNAVLRRITSVFQKQIQFFCRYKAVEPDISVSEDKFSLDSLGINAYLLHTPGHSTGSMSIIIDDEIAIVGDTMLGTSPERLYPPFAADPKLLFKSWGKLINTNCRLFMPSHGRACTRETLVEQYSKYN